MRTTSTPFAAHCCTASSAAGPPDSRIASSAMPVCMKRAEAALGTQRPIASRTKRTAVRQFTRARTRERARSRAFSVRCGASALDERDVERAVAGLEQLRHVLVEHQPAEVLGVDVRLERGLVRVDLVDDEVARVLGRAVRRVAETARLGAR